MTAQETKTLEYLVETFDLETIGIQGRRELQEMGIQPPARRKKRRRKNVQGGYVPNWQPYKV